MITLQQKEATKVKQNLPWEAPISYGNFRWKLPSLMEYVWAYLGNHVG